MLVDLNQQLRFSRGLLALTDRRLMARDPETGLWASWPLRPADASGHLPPLSLRHFDHAGVGTLELHHGGQRLANWRCTLAANVQARRFKAERPSEKT